MSNRLEGKVAAITGAASGFGAAAAERFVREGGRVILGDIQADAGNAMAHISVMRPGFAYAMSPKKIR